MSFYGLLILQKTNFNLASKLFVTAKKSRHPIGCLSFLFIAKAEVLQRDTRSSIYNNSI